MEDSLLDTNVRFISILTLVAVESGPSLVAAALEGLLASAVHAAGQAHAPRAVWAEPSELARAGVGSGAVALASVTRIQRSSSLPINHQL